MLLQGNSNKGKLLTRSHAMKESTSPPRTPVPHSPNDLKSLSPTVLNSADSCNNSESMSHLLTPQFVLPPSDDGATPNCKSQLDIEFPKLTPPKNKFRNNSVKTDKSSPSPDNSQNNSICEENDKNDDFDGQKKKSPLHTTPHSVSSDSSSHPQFASKTPQNYNQENHNNNNNNNNNYYQNKSKPPLKNMGSSSSVEGGTSSGFISRDSSSDQFLDHHAGVDLVQFFKETLNKNAKDRNMLMKIERDMLQLALDQSYVALQLFFSTCNFCGIFNVFFAIFSDEIK